jgi:hypothetical protein
VTGLGIFAVRRYLRLWKQSRKQNFERIHGKAQGDRSLRGRRCEQARADEIAEHTPCAAIGQARDPRNLAALELSADQGLLQEPPRLRLQIPARDIGTKPLHQRVQFEQPGHDLDLVEAHPQKPKDELDQRMLREIAAPVEIALRGMSAWSIIRLYSPPPAPPAKPPSSPRANPREIDHRPWAPTSAQCAIA